MLRIHHVRVLNVQVRYRFIDCGATEAACPSTGQLCRERQASVMHSVFPGGEGALAAMLEEIGFSALREVVFPRALKFGPGQFKARRVSGAQPAAV